MNPQEITLKSVPGLLEAYLPALKPRRSTLALGASLPDTVLRVDDVVIDPERLEAYRDVCGFTPSDETPITFPMALAVPMQVALLTRPEWPLNAAGLVHLGIVIRQHRTIEAGMPLTLRACVRNQSPHKRGLQFDLVVEAQTATGTVWESHSRVLSRDARRASGKRATDRDAVHDGPWQTAGRFEAPSNTGWRYARVSGDWNPIHLSAVSARLFGYRRAIAHGMWTLANTLACLGHGTGLPGESLEAWFRAPLFLPTTAEVSRQSAAGTIDRFRTEDVESGKVVLDGHLRGAGQDD